MRHALELAVALRESARRGGAMVDLPLTGALRHTWMLREFLRWNYKETVHGEEWYRLGAHPCWGTLMIKSLVVSCCCCV